MKKIITNLCFLLFALSLNATIRTVSNSPTTLAQYNSIQAAIDASANGDTVYVHASGVDYGGATIHNKKISLIGPGWSPQTDPGLTASIWGLLVLSGASDGTVIQGINFTGNGQNLNNGGGGILFVNGLNGIQIIRNKFHRSDMWFSCNGDIFTNLLFEGNYCYEFTFGVQNNCGNLNTVWTDVLITNNVFAQNNQPALQYFILTTNVQLDHNLFYTIGGICSACSALLFTNNIFEGVDPSSGVTNSTYNNNITYNCSGTNAPWTLGTNTGTGNIENQDPQMVDQSAVNANIANPLLNFTIPAGPANNSGADGKDLGLLFDPSGYLNWANSRNPKLPVVNSLLINSTANPGGNLEIHLNASQAK